MKGKRRERGLSGKPDEWELEIKIPKLLELKEKEKADAPNCEVSSQC